MSTMLIAAGAAAALPACGSPELPPGVGDEPVVIAQKAPPPISGGTLLVTSKGMAVAADPDRDLVWLVDLNKSTVAKVTLKEDDEPGRVIEDGAGRIHVALRRGGDVVTIDPAAAKIVDRSPVCPAPRGLAYDAKDDVIHVACVGGELVTLPAAGGAPVRSLRLDNDIRDIAVSGDNLLVTRFRAAELLVINKSGQIINRTQPPSFDATFDANGGTPSFVPTGAFRMVPLSGGGVALSHQRSRSLVSPVVISEPDGYGGREGGDGICNSGIVHPTVTTFDANGNPSTVASSVIPNSTLPVDMAVSPDGDSIAVVAAGSDKVVFSSLSQLSSAPGGCVAAPQTLSVGAPIAAAFWNDTLIVQSRVPAQLTFFSGGKVNKLVLSSDVSVEDTGHTLFHHAASDTSAISCASCHLEGHEDGHTWMFDTIGARRTQTLGGDIFQTAPFHWDGDMKDLQMIMDVVFVNRMGGLKKGPRHVGAMQGWMATIPRLPVSASLAAPESIQHGAELFQTSCASCHAGSLYTNNTNKDVGTGQGFQVPSLLGIANRAPYLHDGSAATLRDRFTVAGADQHITPGAPPLSEADIDDLVAYLETL